MKELRALVQVFTILCLLGLLLFTQEQLRQSRRNTEQALQQIEEMSRVIGAVMANDTALPKQSEIDTCKALRMKP